MKDAEAKASEIEPRLIMGLEKFNANYYIDKGICLLARLEKIRVFATLCKTQAIYLFFKKRSIFWGLRGDSSLLF